MHTPNRFDDVLRQWSEVFMGRSMRELSAFMRNSGLSMPQVSLLSRLYYQGQCGVTDIADHLAVTSPAASQLVDRLVQQGLLERNEDPNDRRAKQIALSPAGRQLIQDGIEARVRWTAELTTVLSPEDQAVIVTALDALTSAAIKLDPDNQARAQAT
jgi:DNA-binding MarR family transcriptional regulator